MSVLFDADLHPLRDAELNSSRMLVHQTLDWKLPLRLGASLINLASQKHWDYLNEAVTLFRSAAERDPNDPYIKMFLGRAIGAQALNTDPSVLTRLKWAREGFKYMDEAVKTRPACFYLRLLRGSAQLMAHPILRRGDKLEEDAHLILKLTQTETFTSFDKLEQARFFLFLGNYQAKKANKILARQFWQQAADLGEASQTSNEALARLNNNWQEVGYDGG